MLRTTHRREAISALNFAGTGLLIGFLLKPLSLTATIRFLDLIRSTLYFFASAPSSLHQLPPFPKPSPADSSSSIGTFLENP